MKVKKIINTTLILVVLQFILGMLANIYSKIPSDHPEKVYQQIGFISVHVLVGTGLLVHAVLLATKYRSVVDRKLANIGLANVVLAYIFGMVFVRDQKDVFSFLMSLTFLGALLVYAKLAFSPTSKASK